MIDLLRALGVADETAAVYAPILAEALPLWEIDEPREVAAFMGTCAHATRHKGWRTHGSVSARPASAAVRLPSRQFQSSGARRSSRTLSTAIGWGTLTQTTVGRIAGAV